MLSIEYMKEETCPMYMAQPQPFVLELNRLQNLLKEKENEKSAAHSEIKALRATETLKDKALEELRMKHRKLEENLRVTDNIIQQKNLEINKLSDEKKDALAAQYAAEAALRRLYVDQKDNDPLSIESIIAPLEANIKMYKNEVTSLLEDKRALERLTKSKEAALLETEKILRSALERALIVEEIQNQNIDLRRQIEICLEENRILEKVNRQKVLEVEKLSQTIHELEEAVLAGGATANIVREYQRQISELNEEKRTLERELARAKVSANRVATVVANEWKDENDKVMPVKQWLQERRILQAEMQRLKDKLAVTERTAKAEAQLKEKFKLRLRTLEEGLKRVTSFNVNANVCQVLASNNAGPNKKKCSSQPRAFGNISSPLRHPNVKKSDSLERHLSNDNMSGKTIWTSKSIDTDFCEKENSELMTNADTKEKILNTGNSVAQGGMTTNELDSEDVVSGFLYDKLQKDVINLRKLCRAKDDGLHEKGEEIKVLLKKVETLTKSIETEARKFKKETTSSTKEATSTAKEENKKTWSRSFLKRVTKSS